MQTYANNRIIVITIFIFTLAFSACKKSPAPKPTPVPPVDSQKDIISFIITKTNNTAYLLADANGSLQNDTVFVTVPAETNITSLKPDIMISGVAINPVSGAVQNFSSPVNYTVKAADGSTKKFVVVVNFRPTIFTSSLNGALYAFDALTGQLIWQLHNQQMNNSTPSVYKGYVYYVGNDGFYAVDARSGEQKWKFPLNNGNPGGAQFYNSPVVANDVAYVAPFDGYIYALNTSDGSIKWKTKSADSSSFISSVTLNNNFLYAGCEDGNLYAFDATSGTILWKANCERPPYTNPLIVDGNVCTQGFAKNWIMFNGATGAVIWSRQGQSNISSATYKDGVIYSGGGNVALAMNAINGNILWQIYFTPNGLSYNERSSPAVENGKFFSGSNDGSFYAYELTARTQIWKFATGTYNSIYASPVISDGIVYTSNNNGGLWGLRVSDGSIVVGTSGSNAIHGSPVVVDKRGNKHYPGISGEQQ